MCDVCDVVTFERAKVIDKFEKYKEKVVAKRVLRGKDPIMFGGKI